LLSKIPDYITTKELKSPQDGIAVLVHTTLASLGFRLIAVDEVSPMSDSLLNVLPETWNKNGPNHYLFRYKHEQSSLEYVITFVKLGHRTLINAIADESDKPASLDISTNDFVSPSFYPHTLSGPNASPLVHGFISSHRVADFTSQLKLKIISKLMPGLRKDGYTEHVDEQPAGTTAHPRPSRDNPPPARPDPGRPPLDVYPGQTRNPLEIGRRDLDPFPVNPFQPPSLFPQGGDDGMFPGPNHPMFGGGRNNREDYEHGPWGGDGYLPPMGAPPGARFDPVGPGPMRPFGGGAPRMPGRGNMRGPDNDDFMPPGAGDMFM